MHICQHAGFAVAAAAGKLAGTRRELAGWMARMPFLESPNVDGYLGSASLGGFSYRIIRSLKIYFLKKIIKCLLGLFLKNKDETVLKTLLIRVVR